MRENNFSEERVRKAIKRVVDNRGKAGQARMESFFTVGVVELMQGCGLYANKFCGGPLHKVPRAWHTTADVAAYRLT